MIDRLSFEALGEGHLLFQGYVNRSEVVRPWFGGFWTETDHVDEALRRVKSRTYARDALVKALTLRQEAFGMSEAVQSNLEALRRPSTAAVLTGQQAVLLGGPLYTWFKALTAIRAAQRLSVRTGEVVVPIFWIASDDQDFDEINHVQAWNAEHALVRITYDPDLDTSGLPAFRIPLNERVEGLWRELEECLPSSEFRGAVLAAARECYPPGGTMVTGFARWLAKWFGSMGLIVVEASDPALKRLAVDLFNRELREHPASRQAFDARTAVLNKTGLQPQVYLPEGVLNLMWMEDKRQPIRMRENLIELGGWPAPFDLAGLVRRVRDHPECVSPNVLLSSLYQDTVIPAAIHVVGPEETAFFPQVKPLYRLFDVPEPVLMPRVSATLFERWSFTALANAGVSSADLRYLLKPSGHLQERILGVISFLARYGPEVTVRLLERLPDDPFHHYLIELP